jgi:hypothetical protein
MKECLCLLLLLIELSPESPWLSVLLLTRSGRKPSPSTPGGAKQSAAGNGESLPPEASEARSAHGANA